MLALLISVFCCLTASPTVKFPPHNVTMKKGSTDSRSMTCVIVGDYDSSVYPWTYNNSDVKSPGVTMKSPVVENDLLVYRLTFKNVTKISFGEYACLNATATLSEEPGELVKYQAATACMQTFHADYCRVTVTCCETWTHVSCS